MKLVDVQSSAYTKNGGDHNDKNPKVKFGDHARISKWKKNLQMAIKQIGLRESLLSKI